MRARRDGTIRAVRAAIPEATRRQWSRTYAETPYHELPWFSPRPFPWIAAGAARGVWRRGTPVLDVGCGAGTNAIFLARHGLQVTGVDLAPGAVDVARSRSRRVGARAEFRVADGLDLPFPDRAFGGAIDVGCFHTLPPELRSAYARELARVLRPRGTLLLAVVAREYPGERGPPHRLSLEEVTRAFEEEFLILRSEYRPSYTGRAIPGAMPVYCLELRRRSVPRPPSR